MRRVRRRAVWAAIIAAGLLAGALIAAPAQAVTRANADPCPCDNPVCRSVCRGL